MGTYLCAKYQKQMGGKWVDVENIEEEVKQDYLLFSVLAGVRSDMLSVKPISDLRGLPDDLVLSNKSKTTDHLNYADFSSGEGEFNNPDAVYSWLMLSEILDYFKVPQPESINTDLAYFKDFIENIYSTHGDLRMLLIFE